MAFTATLPLKSVTTCRCSHCRQRHPVIAPHAEGTLYTQAMLYRKSKQEMYFAGLRGPGQPASESEAGYLDKGVTCVTRDGLTLWIVQMCPHFTLR